MVQAGEVSRTQPEMTFILNISELYSYSSENGISGPNQGSLSHLQPTIFLKIHLTSSDQSDNLRPSFDWSSGGIPCCCLHDLGR